MTEHSTSLQRIESEKPAVAPSPGEMMQAMIKSGVTSENVAAFTELVKLSEHMEDRKAARDFAIAFNQLQSEMPNIQATKPVPNKDGSVRYKFCPYEDLMKQVSPLLHKHGFTVTFSNRFEQARIVAICSLTHIGGHSKTNEFAVRIGSGPPGSSETQADGAAGTYAKRFALINALNIVVKGLDNDASLEGAFITPAQAKILRARVLATGADEAKFLAFAQVKVSDNATVEDIKRGYEQISVSMMPMLDASLKKKEDTRK